MVQKVKEQESKASVYEVCVLCGKETDVRRDTHVDMRYNYITGCGQLCRECGAKY